MYQDEWVGVWGAFVQRPVKAIFDHNLMQDPAYSQTERIMDVWDRQMLDAKMARAPAAQAEIFAVLIRVTDRFAPRLMPSSTFNGIYFEPRTMDGRKPDPQFRVIWVPKKNLAQVRLVRSQTEARATIF